MTCIHCNGTGSLSRDLHGYLDCTHCDVAAERVMVEHWARANTPNCDPVDAWLIHQHGVEITQSKTTSEK